MDFPELTRLAGGYAEARILQVAVSLGLFDAIADRGKEASEIAAALKTDRRATDIFLNALVALGLLRKQLHSFFLTPIAATYLVKSSPQYYGGMVEFDASLWGCWGALEAAVRDGKPARGADMYQSSAEDTERFIYAMHSLVEARGDAEIVPQILDLSGVDELLDVGSGPGTYPIHFCRRFLQLRVTIFDLPGTLKVTERFVKASGLQDRIRLIAGDYHTDPIPGSYQLAFLSNIIHAESSEANAQLMAKLYGCLEAGGKIVIKDHIPDDTLANPPVGAIFSLLMLLTTSQGRCYSFNEVKGWLKNARFTRIREISLPPPLTSSLIIGEKD